MLIDLKVLGIILVFILSRHPFDTNVKIFNRDATNSESFSCASCSSFALMYHFFDNFQ